MGKGRFPAFPVLLAFSPLLLASACAATPPERTVDAAEVAVVPGEGRTWLVRGKMAVPVKALDRTRVLRLFKVLYRDGEVREKGREAVLAMDAPESASALVEAARWVDGLVLTRRRPGAGPGLSPAGIIAETWRRYLMVDPPAPPPDWKALVDVLERDAVWEGSPHHAAMGAVLLAGVVRLGETSSAARDRAIPLLSRAVAEHRVPPWLSWIAYRKWTHRE